MSRTEPYVSRDSPSFRAEDLSTHPGHLIRRAQQALNLVWTEEVSRTITSPQFAVLNSLLGGPEVDQQTLGEGLALDRSTMADVVARLASRGLVTWTRHTTDGRRKVIRLTPKGRTVLQEIIPGTRRMSQRLVKGQNPREQEELLRLLTLLVRAHERRPTANTGR